MASKSKKPVPQPMSNPTAQGNNKTEGPANSDAIIESLHSPDWLVEPSVTTNVLVQGSNRFDNGNISWKTSWSAPNGFQSSEKHSEKGPNLNVPFSFEEPAIMGGMKDGDRVKMVVEASADGKVDTEEREFIMKVPTEELKVWEVFFDNYNEDQDNADQTVQEVVRRSDPLIFDLNRDGKLDITGANQEGNGKIDGETVAFDIDPERSNIAGWSFRSESHRPGIQTGIGARQAPAVPGGKAVYNTGKEESTNKHGSGRWREDPSKGTSADIYNAKGEIVGRWTDGFYHWGPKFGSKEEQTEWIKGTGDGFLVWDQNGNGKIDSNTEMMSEYDIQGNKVFENGFEKLSHYFDEDENGVIEGAELEELKFWVDNGDAKTQEGELRELSDFGIRKITIPKKGKLTSSTTATEEKYI